MNRGVNGASASGSSWDPVISGDGSSVAFISSATNLVPGGTTEVQVFQHDIASDTTTVVSQNSGTNGNGDSGGPSISHDGRRVAFWSLSTNLVASDTGNASSLFVRDITTGTTACMTQLPDGQHGGGIHPTLSPGGDSFAFASTTNYMTGQTGTRNVYVRGYGVLSRNAGANPESYAASRAALREEWRASVDLTTTGHTFAVLYAKMSSTNAPLGGGQRLLISGPTIFKLPAQPGPVASWSGILPADPGLVGLPLYTQAVHLFGVTPFALSNAQDLCLTY